MRSCIALFWATLLLMQMGACGGSGSAPPPAPTPASGTIQQPTVMNLYPSTSSANSNRLFIFVTGVGTTPVNMPLAFDTGSAGITLYAPDIFPSTLVSAGGFVFGSGQDSITYAGITVTNQVGTRKYGSMATGRTQTGNIGYARVTFGDSGGELMTAVMPVFLYYLITDNSTGQPVPVPAQRGWFGVNDAPNLITVASSVEPPTGFPACASGTSGSCYVASIFKYLPYGAGVNAGFMTGPAPLQSCDISVAGECAPSPMLTVGLNSILEAGFSTVNLVCPPSSYSGPVSIGGYTVCQAAIADSTVTVSGASAGLLTGTLDFDSGTPVMVLNVPAGAVFPAAVAPGSAVVVGTPSGFTYSFTAGSGTETTATTVQPNSGAASVIGVGYFTTNYLFMDFTSGTLGWK